VSDQPTYLVCAGATKAGTSWLYATLRRHPDCYLRSIKELHYFDTVAKGDFDRQIALRQDELARLEAQDAGDRPAALRRRKRDLREWLAVLERRAEDMSAYLGYLTNGRSARRVVGDITPSYGLLDAGRLRAIARMAADVRIVYLLRDPVARLWSHMRMLARRRTTGAGDFAAAARALMDSALRGQEPRAIARGDYAGALARLDAAVDPKRLLVLFQDDLLAGPGLARLTAFLGISPATRTPGRAVHAGVPLPLADDQHARAVALLQPQYAYVAQRFGHLPESWQRSLDRGVA